MKFSKYNIIHTTENQEHILFNSLWGSTFVISPSVKQAIESSNPTLLTEEENRLFIKYNALIPDEYNESCIYNHFYNKSRYGKKCLTATVLLTWSCNFRCIYCYEGAGELRCENMTKNRAGAIANFLIKCSEEQRGELIHVVLFGGEPLLNIDVGFHMLGILKEYCLTSHKELQCSLVTNGSLLTEEIVSGLLNYNCKFVQITLDGPEYIHNCRRVAKDGSGTFQKVLHGITIMEEFCSQIHSVYDRNIKACIFQGQCNRLPIVACVFHYNADISSCRFQYGDQFLKIMARMRYVKWTCNNYSTWPANSNCAFALRNINTYGCDFH